MEAKVPSLEKQMEMDPAKLGPVPEDLADPQKVGRRKSREKMRVQQELDDLGAILATEQGRRFIHRLLTMCGVLRISYSGPGRAEETAFYEGQRNIGNQLFKQIDENFPDLWFQMRKEARSVEKTAQE